MTGRPDRGGGLSGRRVVVTRPRPLAGTRDELTELLTAAGATALVFPAVRIEPPPDPVPLDRAAATVVAGAYAWIVFTSANAVAAFLPRLAGAGGRALELPSGVRLACVGAATAAELAEWGLAADLVPERHVAEALVAGLAETGDLDGARILFPRASGARRTVPDGLASLGAVVEEVEAYRPVPVLDRAGELRRLLEAGGADAITFMSGSAVAGFVAGAGTHLGGAVVAVVGPVTAEVARSHGLDVHVTAPVHTAAGLVRSLEEYWSG